MAAAGILPLPPPAAHAAVPVLTIEGKGFGHGVGMAQDGAYWMGKAGATTPQILGQFYPGTKAGKASGNVRVAVFTPTDGAAVVAFPGGGEIRDALSGDQSPGFPVHVAPGGQVTLRWDGAGYSVEGGQPSNSSGSAFGAGSGGGGTHTFGQVDPITTTSTTVETSTTVSPSTTSTSTTSTTAATTATTAPPKAFGATSSRTLWAVPSSATVTVPARQRTYRGVIEATAARGPFHLVNQVDVESYLRGMGEVRNSAWPAASLRAQAIAARTYALRAMAANGELCDDQHCQVYLGAQAEYAAMDKAVKDTAGQVVLFGKGLASTVYSANGGAFSASRQEGFGSTDDGSAYPYLRPAAYPTQDPAPWTVRVALKDVAARLKYPGTLTGAAVGQTGPSGRALSITLSGSAGDKTAPGLDVARAFSLKSTLFSLSLGTADSAPAPPPSGGELQAPPEDAGPRFDPNALPPDPLTPDELVRAVPPAGAFTPAPTEPLHIATLPTTKHPWPWASVAFFLLVSAAAAAGGLHFARRA